MGSWLLCNCNSSVSYQLSNPEGLLWKYVDYLSKRKYFKLYSRNHLAEMDDQLPQNVTVTRSSIINKKGTSKPDGQVDPNSLTRNYLWKPPGWFDTIWFWHFSTCTWTVQFHSEQFRYAAPKLVFTCSKSAIEKLQCWYGIKQNFITDIVLVPLLLILHGTIEHFMVGLENPLETMEQGEIQRLI